jgi:hypothetical protein
LHSEGVHMPLCLKSRGSRASAAKMATAAGGRRRRQAAGGRRQAAGGRRQAAAAGVGRGGWGLDSRHAFTKRFSVHKLGSFRVILCNFSGFRRNKVQI